MRGITLNSAQEILNSTLHFARQKHLAPLSIVILDNGAHIKASASEDGVGTLRFEIARGKASAALGMGFGTRQFHHLVKNNVLPEMFANTINGASDGKFIPLPGGILILKDQEVIGAIGISGGSSDQDEMVGLMAIEANGFDGSV